MLNIGLIVDYRLLCLEFLLCYLSMYILHSALHKVCSRNNLLTNLIIIFIRAYNNTRNKNNLGGPHFRYASSQKDNMIVFVNQIVYLIAWLYKGI